jgi:hypothetical protein
MHMLHFYLCMLLPLEYKLQYAFKTLFRPELPLIVGIPPH